MTKILANCKPSSAKIYAPFCLMVLVALIIAPQAAYSAPNSVLLNWTAPGNDSMSGVAAIYDLRYSTSAITAANWASATHVNGVQSPAAAGAAESFNVTGLTSGTTYYFAIKTSDAAGNWSGLSNISSGTTDNLPPVTPTLSSPTNGATVTTGTPTLTVTNTTDPEGNTITYGFDISTVSTFATFVTQVSGVAQGGSGTTSWVVPVPLTNGTYYWRVRAFDGNNYSGYAAYRSLIVSISNNPPTTPALSTPANGGTVVTATPTLTLTNSTDPEGNTITYSFDVATSNMFTTIVSQVTGVAQGGSGTTSWVVANSLTNGSTYYWRARAYDGNSYSGYSSVRSMVVAIPNNPPTTPALSTPADGGTVVTATPTLTLTNSTDPEGNTITYNFDVATSNTFATIVSTVTGVAQGGSGTTSWVVANALTTGNTYYWRARAYDGNSYSGYSVTRSMIVSIPNNPPTTPTLSSPVNGGSVNTATPTLTLNNSTDPEGGIVTYSFDVATSNTFATIVSQVTGVTQGLSTTTSWVVANALTNGSTYYWRARANDGVNNSGYSVTRSFTVSVPNNPPTTPTINSPISDVRITNLLPVLTTNNSTDADGDPISYQFQIYNSTMTTLIAQSALTPGGASTTSWTVSVQLNSKTRFAWRVRANDTKVNSNWSTVAYFKTNRAPLPPTPISPANGDTIYGTLQGFVFNNGTDPDADTLTYDVQVYSDSSLTKPIELSTSIPQGSPYTVYLASAAYTTDGPFYWRARSYDGAAWSNWSTVQKFWHSQVTLDVDDGGTLPNAFTLRQNYPNPFNPTTNIGFTLLHASHVTLAIYNLSGELVKEIINSNLASGSHEVIWSGENQSGSIVPSGVYFYRIQSGDLSQTKKMIMLK